MDERKEMLWMLADLESDPPSPTRDWAIAGIRRKLAQLDEIESDGEALRKRANATTHRMLVLARRMALVVARGGWVPPPGTRVADIRRKAQRLREKKAEPRLSDEAREAKARLLDEAAEITEEMAVVRKELQAVELGLAVSQAKQDALNEYTELQVREKLREIEQPEMLTEANRNRHRTSGRGGGK